MKISQDKMYVQNKFGRVFTPEFIYLTPTSLDDGWYINGKLADSIETKVLNPILQEMVTDSLTVNIFADKIIGRSLTSHPVRLPKMTKAQSVALEGLGTTFIKIGEAWEIAGYGLHNNILSSLLGSFTISSGILQPLMTGGLYEIALSKDNKWAIFIEGQEYFVCGTMEKND